MHVACQIEADSCEIVSGVVGKIWKSNLQNSLLTHGIEKFATSKVVNRNYIYNTADSGSSFSERRLLQTTRVPPQRTSVTFVKYFQKLIYYVPKIKCCHSRKILAPSHISQAPVGVLNTIICALSPPSPYLEYDCTTTEKDHLNIMRACFTNNHFTSVE